MANELRIKVVFDTGEAGQRANKLAVDIEKAAQRKADAEVKAATKAEQAYLRQWQQAEKLVERYSRFEVASNAVNGALGNTTRASGSAATTMQALNFTIRDSAYFTKDLSLGVLAVGNNLNPLIDGLIRTNQAAKAAKTSLGTELLNSLKGGGGLILAFSLAVTAIQAVTFALAKNKKEVSETKTEYDKLTDAILQYSKQALGGLIIDLESRQTAFALALATGRKLTEQEQNTAMEIQKQVKFAKERLRTMGDIESINNRMSELETEKKMLKNTGLVDGLVSPASVARLKEINAELEKLRNLTSAKDKGGKNSLKTLMLDLQGIAQELARELANTTQKANELFYFDPDGKGAQQVTIGDYRQDAQDRRKKLWDRFGFTEMDKTTVPKSKEIMEQYFGALKEDADDTKKALQGIDQAANIAGNAISNAFLNGKDAMDAATQALKQFIVQLLVVQSLKYVLTAIFAPSSLPTTVAGFFGFGKKTVAQSDSMPATPELSRVLSSANSIAQKQNTTMVVNVQGELVGSGSNLKAIIKKRDKITAKYY